jgi:hypothetical protein
MVSEVKIHAKQYHQDYLRYIQCHKSQDVLLSGKEVLIPKFSISQDNRIWIDKGQHLKLIT